MNKLKINLWNRDFDLFISYSCYPGEKITEVQNNAVANFERMEFEVMRILDEVKKYIEDTTRGDISTLEIDNVFEYVMPKSIYVPRTNEEIVAIICNYKLDMEHGIAVVFENGRFKEIGPQDIIL